MEPAENMRKFGIIGFGKVGKTLALTFFQHGYLFWILARNKKITDTEFQLYYSIKEIKELPDVIIISVNDDEVENVALKLSLEFNYLLKDKIIFHCAGIISSDALSSCSRYGAITASAHPYQTFYHPSPEILKDVPWGIEAGENYEIFAELIRSIGGKPINLRVIPGFDRALYHCSAVAGSNFMNVIINLASLLAKRTNLQPEELLPTILKTTLNNNFQSISSGTEIPITGPFPRGNISTIKKHINSIKKYPELLNIYCYLGLAANEASNINKLISKNKYNEINDILKRNIL